MPQLSEDVGEQLAKWAAGSAPATSMTAAQLIAEFAACSEPSEFRRLEEVRRVSWSAIGKDDKPSVKAASDQATKRIDDAAKAPVPMAVEDMEGTAAAVG